MSRAAELAREEADAVEAAENEQPEEDADTGDDAGNEQPEEDAPQAADEPADEPSSNVSMEKALKQMERENERHAKRVAEIMGADFELVHVCEACAGFAAGFTLEAPDTAPELLHGEMFERCVKCNGWGAVLTGSVNDIGRTTTCQNCTGQGYVTKVPTLPDVPAPASVLNPNHSVADQLRAQGYMVIEPPTPAPAPGV